uniref:C2H2-type domain-containing protein n=1 Tax=Poecilia mexicana TaxID=48701 RepID=A0A3B3XX90_9TELE
TDQIIGPFVCRVCNKDFSLQNTLNRHIFCSKGFSLQHNLKSHMHLHTGEKPFVCSVCSKGFLQQLNLKNHMERHMRLHTEERPFGCDVCKSRFTHKCNLESHMRVHSGEKPFVCDVCMKAFSQQGDLKRHMLVNAADPQEERPRFESWVFLSGGGMFSQHIRSSLGTLTSFSSPKMNMLTGINQSQLSLFHFKMYFPPFSEFFKTCFTLNIRF